MTSLFGRALSLLDLALLRGAALLVPRAARREWQREWQAELWHVRHACTAGSAMTWRGEVEAARFCGGAYQDALCLRRDASRTVARAAPHRALKGSAINSIAVLGMLLTAAYGISVLLPGVRAKLDASHYQVRDGVILIHDAYVGDDEKPTIAADRFRRWKTRDQSYFDAFAFYRVAAENVQARATIARRLVVAHASPDLFALLGLPVGANGTAADLPAVILSTAAWKADFDASSRIVGTLVDIGGVTARVAAVVPEGAWRLPGRADAWLLQPDNQATGTGYVIAHLNRRGRGEMLGDRVAITSTDADDGSDSLWGVSFAERMMRPRDMFLFTLFLALLALPAVTSVSMGEYSFNTHGSNWRRKLTRWSFLLFKITLLVPAAYFGSLDLAYCATTRYSAAAVYVQLLSSFVLCLFGLRWVMLDQRQRCPVCLCRVAHPAQVGQAGQTFLAWNGTEMMCRGGHTLLHVPGLPTSWFSTQRWIYLDTSWEFLFAGTKAS